MSKTKKAEALVSCPDCGRNNFTPDGLKRHKCNVRRSINGLNTLSDEEKERSSVLGTFTKGVPAKESDGTDPDAWDKDDVVDVAPLAKPAAKRLTKQLVPAEPVSLVPVKNSPTLTLWSDQEAATKVRQLVRDAQDGLRRIIVCGLYLEAIKMDLPHGQFQRWVEAHCPDVSYRTCASWMSIASNLREACGIKSATAAHLKYPIYEVIALLPEDRPEEVRDVCARMDELMAGKSARQLLLEFKQAEVDEDGNLVARRGRLPGSKSNRRRKGIQEGLDETAAESVEFLTNLKGDLYLAATGNGITRIPRELLEGLLQNSVQLSTRIRELLKSH